MLHCWDFWMAGAGDQMNYMTAQCNSAPCALTCLCLQDFCSPVVVNKRMTKEGAAGPILKYLPGLVPSHLASVSFFFLSLRWLRNWTGVELCHSRTHGTMTTLITSFLSHSLLSIFIISTVSWACWDLQVSDWKLLLQNLLFYPSLCHQQRFQSQTSLCPQGLSRGISPLF